MQYAQVPSGAVIGAQVPGCGPKQELTNDAALTNINDYSHFQGRKIIISQLRLDQENESRTRAALSNKQRQFVLVNEATFNLSRSNHGLMEKNNVQGQHLRIQTKLDVLE